MKPRPPSRTVVGGSQGIADAGPVVARLHHVSLGLSFHRVRQTGQVCRPFVGELEENMKRWKVGVMAAGGAAAAAVGAMTIGMFNWNRTTKRAVRQLATPTGAARPIVVVRDGLPAPVARYFAYALVPGRTPVTAARVASAGTFLTKRGAKRSPFVADQHFSVQPPGFVWDAKIAMAPLVSVRVRDSYVGGEGAMLARAAGVIPVVSQHGTPEMADASLQRFLAESVWFPTALLPSAGVVWTPIDESSARASLTDRGNTVSVDFQFGVDGQIDGFTAMRNRDVDGRSVLTMWRGRMWDYERVDGMMVPRGAEVEWVLADGPLTYWRGHITRLTYEFGPPVSVGLVGAR
jgi:hypothetical protein